MYVYSLDAVSPHYIRYYFYYYYYEHVYSQEAEYIKKLKVTIKYNNNNTSNNTIHVKNKT